MRTVHFVLNGGWLVLCGAMLLVPCVHLLQAWRYSLNRYGASSGKFAVLGSLKTLCFIVAGSTVPLLGVHWKFEELCWGIVVIFGGSGMLLLRLEAPIRGLFDVDGETVLRNQDMLKLWYEGVSAAYTSALEHSGKGIGYSFSRTNAWAWDNPDLRLAAYYIKAQGAVFVLALLLLRLAIPVVTMVVDFQAIKPSSGERIFSDLGLYARVAAILFVGIVLFPFVRDIHREWMAHYRALAAALEEHRDPDLSDRARLAEMRRTVLGWARENGCVSYDREARCWRLRSGMERVME